MSTSQFWARLTVRKPSGKGIKDSRSADSRLRGQVLSAILGGIARAVVESLLRWLYSLL